MIEIKQMREKKRGLMEQRNNMGKHKAYYNFLINKNLQPYEG